MVDPFTIGIAVGAAVLFMLSRGACPPGAELAEPDDKDLLALTEWKSTVQGLARYFTAKFIPSIALTLPQYYVEKVSDKVYKGSRIIVYRLYQGAAPAGQSAADIAKIGYGAGAAVLFSETIWLPKAGAAVYMAIVPYQHRSAFTRCGRAWAIEFDDQAGESTPSKKKSVPVGQGGSTTSAGMFDSNMTQQEQADAAAMINRSDLAPEFYDAQAIAAETPGHGGTNHGVHPKCAAMMRARAAELRGSATTAKKKDPIGLTIPKDDTGAKTVPPDVIPPQPKVVDGITYDANCDDAEIALGRPLFARVDIKPDEYPPVIYAAENCEKHGPHPMLAAQLKVKMASQQLLFPGTIATNDDDGGGEGNIFGPWQG